MYTAIAIHGPRRLLEFGCKIHGFSANLCNFLFVVNYKQWHRQQDGSKTFDCFLKSPSCGQLVALLQAGDEVRETQANSWKSILRLVFLKGDRLRFMFLFHYFLIKCIRY